MPAASRPVDPRLRAVVQAAVQGSGGDLEELSIKPAGGQRVLTVVVDREDGLDLDGVAEVAAAVSAALDEAEDLTPESFLLEVTSPGVDRPLTEPRHWQRNVGRLVAVSCVDGRQLSGRLLAAGRAQATVEVATRTSKGRPPKLSVQSVDYAEVRRAQVEVDFSAVSKADLPEDSDLPEDADPAPVDPS